MDTAAGIQGHARLCGCAACTGSLTAAGASPQDPAAAGIAGSAGLPNYVSALLAPDEYRWNFNAPGSALSLTYGFMTAAPWYATADEYPSFRVFTAAQRQAVDRAVQNYEEVCNVDFTFVANGDAAQVRFGSARLSEWEAAHAYYPQRYADGDWEGDVWFNNTETYLLTPNPGTYAYMVTLHEIGHALALKHPFYTSFWPASATLPSGQDNRQYTVMSYNDHPAMPVEEPASLLLYDIAAAQYLYGANTATRSGDTIYSWSADDQFISCIWDGGGNDMIDASGQTRRVVISLEAGSFSSIGSYRGGNAINNLSIAFNCVIENAIGGSGNDTITGNEFANRLEGGAGDDVLDGYTGQDSFIGGAGFDTVSYARALQAVGIDQQRELFSGEASGDSYSGIEAYVGTRFDDVFVGDGAATTFIGGDGNDTIDGGAGTDIASYRGTARDYEVTTNQDGTTTVRALRSSLREGADTLSNIETIRFEGTSINRAPTAYGASASIARNTTRLAVDLVSNADSDGDAITRYEFRDSTAGAGYFTLGGTTQAANQTFSFGPADSSTAVYHAGLGADTIQARVFDGVDWSSWTSFTISRINMAPSLTAVSQMPAHGATSVAASALVNASDPDADPVVTYQFWDQDAGGGHFTVNGTQQSDNVAITVAAADIGTARYQLGSTSDMLWMRASDGMAWSEWKSATVAAPRNYAPIAAGLNQAPGRSTTSLAAGSLVSVSDADSDPVLTYQFWDQDAGGGYFTVNGAQQSDNVAITVAAADIGTARYQLGATDDTLWVRASDGMAWSGWTPLTVTAPQNRAPNVAGINQAGLGRGTTSLAASALVNASDSDNDPVLAYQFWDQDAGGGYFTLNGTPQNANVAITVAAADIGTARYQLGSSSDMLWVRASDGLAWSEWKSLTVTAPENHAPIVAGLNQSPARGTASIAASSLLNASDADGDPIVTYQFWDQDAGGGYFTVNSARQSDNVAISVAAADVGTALYQLGASDDTLWVRASDGMAWSEWKSLIVTAPRNHAPDVIGHDRQASPNASLDVSTLFTVSDRDGDTLTRYQFWDSAEGGGQFVVSGTPEAANSVIEVMSNQLAAATFVTSSTGGTDLIWARAYDGTSWGEWKSSTVTILAQS